MTDQVQQDQPVPTEDKITKTLKAFFPSLSPLVFHYAKQYPGDTTPAAVIDAVTVAVPLRFFMAAMTDIAKRYGDEIRAQLEQEESQLPTPADETAVNGGE